MIKHVVNYLPPADWKPAKLLKKIIIPIEKFPQAAHGKIVGSCSFLLLICVVLDAPKVCQLRNRIERQHHNSSQCVREPTAR